MLEKNSWCSQSQSSNRPRRMRRPKAALTPSCSRMTHNKNGPFLAVGGVDFCFGKTWCCLTLLCTQVITNKLGGKHHRLVTRSHKSGGLFFPSWTVWHFCVYFPPGWWSGKRQRWNDARSSCWSWRSRRLTEKRTNRSLWVPPSSIIWTRALVWPGERPTLALTFQGK